MNEERIKLLTEAIEHGDLNFSRTTKPKEAVGSPTIVSFWDGSFLALCAVVYVVWMVKKPEVG